MSARSGGGLSGGLAGRGAAPLSAIVDDLIALAGIPAPTFDEDQRVAWLEERLRTAPGVRRRDRVGNLIWSFGKHRPEVLFTAHLDTVFDATTPLDITREDGIIRGPGVGDNAAAVAVAINVFERAPPASRAGVAFTVGEEGLGNLRGAREAVATLRPTTVIALEGHGLDRVFADAVGSLRARVSVHGPGGHPWVDSGTESSIHAVLELGTSMLETRGDQLLINIGMVSGGRSVNAIADYAELLVEGRSRDAAPLERFETLLADLHVPEPLELDVEIVGRRPAARLDRDSELLKVVLEVREQLGLSDTVDSGSTDANVALANGIPAVALGVANGSGMHTPTEWIDQASLTLGYQQVAGILARLTSLDG